MKIGGWAHVVMNVDLTIAVTQNFCSPTGLERSYLKARTSRPKFTLKWVKKLPKRYQEDLECVKTVPLLKQASSSSSNDSSSSSSDSSSSSSSSTSSSEAKTRTKNKKSKTM